jgi:hypothetical protein
MQKWNFAGFEIAIIRVFQTREIGPKNSPRSGRAMGSEESVAGALRIRLADDN